MIRKSPSDSSKLTAEMRKEVKQAFHKQHWKAMAELCVNDKERTRILFDFFLSDDDHVARPAAEILRHMSDLDQSIVQPHIDELIERLKKPGHDGIIRGVFRMFQRAKFSEEQAGKIVDPAFDFLQNRKYPVAIRVFAMTTIYNLSKSFPELYDELCNVISTDLDRESMGYQNRANKILTKTWK